MSQSGDSLIPIPAPVVAAVDRLARLREDIRRMEMEEKALRDDIVSALAQVPDDRFPLSVGPRQVRIIRRPGRFHESQALAAAEELGLGQQITQEIAIADPAACQSFPAQLEQLTMTQATRRRLQEWYQAAFVEQPRLPVSIWEAWHQRHLVDEATYAKAFKDHCPWVLALQVR